MAKRSAPRALTQDVIAHMPENAGSEIFPAGTTEAELPEWALVSITNPHVWTDAPAHDNRVEGMLVPRLLAFGAPQRMVDDIVESVGELPESDRPAVVTDMLRLSSNDGDLRSTIESWRRQNEVHGGETYDEYRARADDAAVDPVAFDVWLIASDLGPLAVEQGTEDDEGRENGTQPGSGDPAGVSDAGVSGNQ